MNPVIRRATIADASFLISANQTMALETEGMVLPPDVISQGVRNLFAKPEYGFYLVATIDGTSAGCLMVTTEWSDWRNGLFWWVQSVFVKDEFRRKGVFRSLYTAAKELATANKNVVGFRLYVEKENKTAQQTYQSMGMSETHYKMFEEMVKHGE